MKTILILVSNPKRTTVLDLNREIRDIKEGLKRARDRDEFKVEICTAVRPIDLRRTLLEIKPAIVHFCGHGVGYEGLCLEDDNGNTQLVSTEALSDLFRIFANDVGCLVINTCYSEIQARAIVEHINYVVGMNRAVRDMAAINFAVGFYDGLGAGKTIKEAFEIARNAVLLEIEPNTTPDRKFILDESEEMIGEPNLAEHLIPVFYQKQDLGIQAEYTDPQFYTGEIWTCIIPEADNIKKRHLVTIDWGDFFWQQTIVIPVDGVLLGYEKRNQDLSPRIVTVAPSYKSYPTDGVKIVSDKTQIINGHLEKPQIGCHKNINEGWQKIRTIP